MPLESPLPVTLLTGFLGSGKTTVLNHLVRTLPRTAILMNEFGEVALDHQLLKKMDGPIALLSGGCVCCMISYSTSSKHAANLHGSAQDGKATPGFPGRKCVLLDGWKSPREGLGTGLPGNINLAMA